ncbi:MAG: hypothetical protein QXG00_01520 [Candidatus Woesearchaeota archaeon]
MKKLDLVEIIKKTFNTVKTTSIFLFSFGAFAIAKDVYTNWPKDTPLSKKNNIEQVSQIQNSVKKDKGIIININPEKKIGEYQVHGDYNNFQSLHTLTDPIDDLYDPTKTYKFDAMIGKLLDDFGEYSKQGHVTIKFLPGYIGEQREISTIKNDDKNVLTKRGEQAMSNNTRELFRVDDKYFTSIANAEILQKAFDNDSQWTEDENKKFHDGLYVIQYSVIGEDGKIKGSTSGKIMIHFSDYTPTLTQLPTFTQVETHSPIIMPPVAPSEQVDKEKPSTNQKTRNNSYITLNLTNQDAYGIDFGISLTHNLGILVGGLFKTRSNDLGTTIYEQTPYMPNGLRGVGEQCSNVDFNNIKIFTGPKIRIEKHLWANLIAGFDIYNITANHDVTERIESRNGNILDASGYSWTQDDKESHYMLGAGLTLETPIVLSLIGMYSPNDPKIRLGPNQTGAEIKAYNPHNWSVKLSFGFPIH